MQNLIVARRDPSLAATVMECRPLLYGAGADTTLDRPAHVRAASALTPWRDVIALVQDDSNFLALLDPRANNVEAITLPAGHGGLRQFDDIRGNKKHKLDLEACVAIPGESPMLLILGSGSKPRREVAILLEPETSSPEVIPLPAFYANLRAERRFAGSELNIEGAAFLGDRIRLFNRGNGAIRGDTQPVNASVDVSWPALRAHLIQPGNAPPPALGNVLMYDLGSLDDVPLTFTDALAHDGRIYYVAAAEASPDAVRDGHVSGSALGVIDGDTARWVELRTQDGAVFGAKVEGICVNPVNTEQFFVVVDRDEPGTPAELCTVRVAGLA